MRLPGVVAILLWCALPAQAQQPQPVAPSPIGEWLVAKKVARIKIVNCDNRLWGVVSWEAQAGVDSQNPDPKLRDRLTLGMPVLLGMRQSNDNKWEGEIYNAQNGRTYNASISLRDENTLKVEGCVLSVLCGGENWTRVEDQEPAPQKQPPSTKQPPGAKQPPAKQPSAAKSSPPTKRGDVQASDSEKICASIPGATGSSH